MYGGESGIWKQSNEWKVNCWGNKNANERKGSKPIMWEGVTQKFVDTASDVWKWNYCMEVERKVENKFGTNE